MFLLKRQPRENNWHFCFEYWAQGCKINLHKGISPKQCILEKNANTENVPLGQTTQGKLYIFLCFEN
jgi:hypothetical protein